MKYKAIIFDMDGTIVNTEHIWKNAAKKLLLKRGINITLEEELTLERQIRGLATHKSCRIIKDSFKLLDPIEDLINEKTQLALDNYGQGITFINGFLDFHKKLNDLNLEKGIATNANKATVEKTNIALNLENLFGKHIYYMEHVNFICKPDPAIFLFTAKQLNIDPSQCIVIEDSEHGLTAAKKAGMFAIGINSNNNKAYLKQADLIIDNYKDIDLKKLLK